MRHFIRRVTLFPIVLIGFPIIYFVAWCVGGATEAKECVFDFYREVWG